MDQQCVDKFDREMMRFCLQIAAQGGSNREFPFGAVITRHGTVVAEATNQVVRDGDVTRHAELVVVSEAQRLLGHVRLADCTLYSIAEPCAMCSFPIRETRIGRVVFSLRSPLMGGFSRWDVLRDERISAVMPEMFGPVPEVVSGVLANEAEKVWDDWNPVAWQIMKKRGCFHAAISDSAAVEGIADAI